MLGRGWRGQDGGDASAEQTEVLLKCLNILISINSFVCFSSPDPHGLYVVTLI